MADIAERMKSLRGVARADAPPAAVPEMDQFRADFKLVWQWRLRSGWFSQEEFGPIYDHAGRAVRDNSGDPGVDGVRRPRLRGAGRRHPGQHCAVGENPRRSAPRKAQLRQIS